MSKKLYFISLILLSLMFLGCDKIARNESAEPNGNGEKKEVAENTAKENNAQETSSKSSLPKEKELDLQANHPNGTVLRITKISFNEDSIVLGFSVTNGHKYEIELSQNTRMQLKDNLGNQYNLSPPKTNPEIEVPTGSTINGNLIFLGRISPDAKSLTLTTNHDYDSQTSEYSRSPRIVIDNIPVERN